MILSVVIPCFNEIKTIKTVISSVYSQPFDIELIVADDNSTDGTREFLLSLQEEFPKMLVLLLKEHRGKGYALRNGIIAATGDIVLIQDADLEYSPNDYFDLLAPIVEGNADIVFGTRLSNKIRKVPNFWKISLFQKDHTSKTKTIIAAFPYPFLSPLHKFVNKFFTFLCNLVINRKLSDIEACYKVFKRCVIQSVTLEEDRFGIEPEIVIKTARIKNIRIYEVPISYKGRTYNEGKKFKFKDLYVDGIGVIIKYGFFSLND